MSPKQTRTAKPTEQAPSKPTGKTSVKTIVLTVLATVVVVFVIVYIIGSRSATKTPSAAVPTQAAAPVTRPITKGTDDPKRVVSFEAVLARLLTDYRAAQVLSNGFLMLKVEVMTPEEFAAYKDLVVAKWKDVASDSDALTPFATEKVTLRRTLRDLFRVPAAQAQEGEVELQMPKWDQIELVKGAAPSISTVKVVQAQFGVTAKDAQKIIEDHYSASAASWGDWAKIYGGASDAAKVLQTSSKVALFVGGTIVTAGGTALLTMPAGAALATGFAAPVASLGYLGGTITAINGADVIMSVNETVSSVAFRDKESAAAFADMQKKISPLTTVVGLVSLKDGLDDAGNLVTAYDWASWGYDKLTADVSADSVTFHPGTLPSAMPTLTADGLLNAYAVPNSPYRIIIFNPNAPATTQTEAPIKIAPAGTYVGKATFNIAIPQMGTRTFTYDLTLTVDADGSTTFDVKGSGAFTFSPTAQFTISYPYSLSSKLEGTTDADGVTEASGSFTSKGSVVLPKGISVPPGYQNMNYTSTGSATAKGSISAGYASGKITMTANGGASVTGDWKATKQ